MKPQPLTKLTVPNNVPYALIADADPRDRSGEDSMDTVKIRGLLNREAGMCTTCTPRSQRN